MHYEKFQDGTVKCIEDEIPFEVPNSWAWTRICNIATVKGGKRIPKGMTFSNKETNHAYIRVIDMKNDTVNLSNLKYIDDNVFDAIQNYIVSKDDLYITIAGTIGVVGEIPLELDGMNLTENAAKISAIEIEKSYLCLVLQSAYCQKQFHQKTYQVAMPKLGLERICSTLIPMCSLKTQKQILEYAKTALSSVNFIEKSKNSLANSILCTKSKILDLAIRGKLVPQDPNEEPASVLLERIQAEKEELIKQGKIKRDKNDSVIFRGDDNSYYEKFRDGMVKCIEDEIPFETPKGWVWCRLKMLGQYKKGPFGSSITKSMFVPDEPNCIKVYEQKNAINKDASLGTYFITNEKFQTLKPFEVFPNDIIVSCAGTIGETYVLPTDIRQGIINQALMKITLFDLSILEFYLIYFDSVLKVSANSQGHGVALKNIPPFGVLKQYLIPLPPLDEQKRIVYKINNLFEKIDCMEQSFK